jgi:hypothetical protein
MDENPEQISKNAEHAEDRHQKEREVLFANETLVVKVLQAVSGAAMIGALSQADTLIDFAGIFSFLLFLTAMGLALISAVLTAHWKHQYKMWDVKGRAATDETKKTRWHKRSGRYLIAMRTGMWTSLLLIVAGLLQLIVFLWIVGLNAEPAADDVETSVQAKFSVGAAI